MNKLLLAIGLTLFITMGNAQTTLYFKGEWTKKNKNELYAGIFKITITRENAVNGELLWTYLATDETDSFLLQHYKGKKGRRAIEFVEGSYNPSSHDMYFEGMKRTDPDDVIGLDKYSLKLSADKKALYGRTDDNGTNEGMFYGVQMNAAAGKQELDAIKKKLKN